MSKGNKKGFSNFLKSKYNKAALLVVEIAVLLTVVALTCVVLLDGDSDEGGERYVLQNQPSTELITSGYAESFVYTPNQNAEVGVQGSENTVVTAAGYVNSVNNSGNGGSNNQTQVQASLADPSGWSRAQIVAKAADAVNKTKAYNNALSVNHKESFNATVTECSGGAIVETVANAMVGWVVKPVDETLNYQNGQAVNSEGETVPIVLPKKNNFYLDPNGATSASAKVVNNEYVLNISLVEEHVGMYEVPKHNASAIGYLDVAGFDLSFLTVDSADITYKGSSLELHINSAGYVTYAEYHIPLVIKGSGHSGNISGSVTFDGEQSEVWTLSY